MNNFNNPGSFQSIGRVLILAILAWQFLAPAARGASVVLLTADSEGHVNACSTCPNHVGFGGLERRATSISDVRGKDSALLLDAGNFLVGAESIATKGEIIVAAYDAMGYDVVHLTPKDLYWGREKTLEILKPAKFSVVSANLLDAQTLKPIVAPYVVKKFGTEKIAIIGISESPAGLQSLPHLQKQLAGITIRPPAEALDEFLPKAKAEAQHVIVLYQGTGRTLRALREKLAGSGVVIFVSGFRPENLPAEGDPPVAATDEHGKSIARGEFIDGKFTSSQLPIAPGMASDEGMTRLIAKYAEAPAEFSPATAPSNISQPPIATNPATLPSIPPQPAVAIVPATLPAQAAIIPSPATLPAVTAITPPTTLPTTRYTGTRVTAKQDRQPKGLAGVGLSEKQVNDAIDRGADWLWAKIKADQLTRKDGRLGDDGTGYDLLYSLALVKAGAHKRIPDFDQALRVYLGEVRPQQLGTYSCGILCMLIDDYGDAMYLPKLRLAARYLLEGQEAKGSWNYNPSVSDDALKDPNSDKAVQVWGGVPPEGSNAQTWKRISPNGEDRSGDNSVSQYALLGLHAAAHCGVEVPPETWKHVYDLYQQRQRPDGAWGYVNNNDSPSGGMTCAGIYAGALAKYHSGDKNATADEIIERGLGWLASNFSATDNPANSGTWVYYYLYSLERAARTLGTEFIGEHEWYPQGASFLLAHQNKDGFWPISSETRPEVSTSFALLFLSRGTVALDKVRPHGGNGVLKTASIEPPSPRVYIILDCSGSMLSETGTTTKFDAARDAINDILAGLPDKTQVALRAYGHRKRALDEGANDDTELLLPMADMKRDELAAAMKRLRARGLTPLALSLKEAAKDLANAYGKDQAVSVILLTDGGEDTRPRKDPVAAAEELARVKNVTLQIVGFDIDRDDWGQQLKAMARAGHGRYWPAADPKTLRREMRAAVLRIPEGFTITNAEGKELAKSTFGQSVPLPEGRYTFTTNFADLDFKESFWINTDATTAVLFDAGKIDFTPPPSPGAAK